jgi:lysyl-tRNA synthetase class 2
MSFWNVTSNAAVCLTFLDGAPVSLAGRVVGFRRQGGIAFGHIVDNDGRIQFCFQKKTFERPEQFREWMGGSNG